MLQNLKKNEHLHHHMFRAFSLKPFGYEEIWLFLQLHPVSCSLYLNFGDKSLLSVFFSAFL